MGFGVVGAPPRKMYIFEVCLFAKRATIVAHPMWCKKRSISTHTRRGCPFIFTPSLQALQTLPQPPKYRIFAPVNNCKKECSYYE